MLPIFNKEIKYMKRITIVFLMFTVLFTSCGKNDSGCGFQESSIIAPQAETDAVAQYLAGAGITDAVKHPSGFYYKIQTPGTGTVAPTLCSQIGINYKGQLTNGTVFDQTTTQMAVFSLGQLIVGWQKGIPLIKTGGKIVLYLPPSLGYGSQVVRDAQGNTLIPANSILVFNVELVAIG
jgi:FKBP-type peptidyl-prolyl cis-trans isomerase FkpA